MSFTEFFEGIFRYEGDAYETIYSRTFNARKGGIDQLSYQIVTLERYGESFAPNHPVYKALEAHLLNEPWTHKKAA